jgi:hypothetical protein
VVAREKLNAVVVAGCMLISLLIGGAFNSWLVFFLTLIVTIALGYDAGAIRDHPDGRPPTSAQGGHAARPWRRGRRG